MPDLTPTEAVEAVRANLTGADAEAFIQGLGDLSEAVQSLEDARDASEALAPDLQADALALVQTLRQRLALLESDLGATLGKAAGKHTGYLSDGRQFTFTRTADRKEWDHEGWKRDARRNVVALALEGLPAEDGVLQVIHDATGEVMPVRIASVLQTALATIQETHGSTSPRSTNLKALGLYVGDYCTSTPGPWRLNAVKPTETTTTPTTTEGP